MIKNFLAILVTVFALSACCSSNENFSKNVAIPYYPDVVIYDYPVNPCNTLGPCNTCCR